MNISSAQGAIFKIYAFIGRPKLTRTVRMSLFKNPLGDIVFFEEFKCCTFQNSGPSS